MLVLGIDILEPDSVRRTVAPPDVKQANIIITELGNDILEPYTFLRMSVPSLVKQTSIIMLELGSDALDVDSVFEGRLRLWPLLCWNLALTFWNPFCSSNVGSVCSQASNYYYVGACH